MKIKERWRALSREVRLGAGMGMLLLASLASGCLVGSFILAGNESAAALATGPSVSEISQRMALVCPSAPTTDQRAECTLLATRQLVDERTRALEVRYQGRDQGLVWLALSVSGASLVATFYGLLVLLETLENTKIAANAARDAATAATKANSGFELSAERQLRAYLHVTSATIEEFRPNGSPRIQLKYKNVGQTPAYDVSTAVELVISAPNQERSSALLSTDPANVLGPGVESRLVETVRARLGAEVYHSILTEAQWLYAYGVIRYRDAFHVQRETRFAYRYAGMSGDQGPMAISRGNTAT